VITGSALTPYHTYERELGIEIPIKIDTPHCVELRNFRFSILTHGKKGKDFNFSFIN
jgi:hypothetical protein